VVVHIKCKSSGLSLVEVLGAVAVIATVATISVIAVKDSVQAGQRSAVQRELQHLNSALQNFRSAGGAVPVDAEADAVVNLLREGVDFSGSNFTPLSADPAMTREIAGVPYSLEYDDENGFTYEPESGEGGVLGGSGSENANNTFPFDVTDAADAQAALAELGALEPGTQEYNDMLAALNAANMLGTISDEDLSGAGLIELGGQWMPQAEAYAIYAQDAQALLNGGAGWAGLSPVQQEGYANVYPELAVALGGAGALNLMDEGILTPELVTGFVLNSNTWVAPQLSTGAVANNSFANMNGSWAGWNTPLPVMRVTDPLLPAELIGYLTPKRVPVMVQSGFTFIPTGQYNYSYDASLIPGVNGASLVAQAVLPSGGLTGGGGSLGGGSLGGGSLGGGSSMPLPTPTATTSMTNAAFATFGTTTGGQIVILGSPL